MAQRRPAKLAWITLDPGPPLDDKETRLSRGDRRISGRIQSARIRTPSERFHPETCDGASVTRISLMTRPQSAPPKLSCNACAKKRYLQQQDCALTSLRLSYTSRRGKTDETRPVQSKHSFLTGAVYNSKRWLDVNNLDRLWLKHRHIATDTSTTSRLPGVPHSQGKLFTSDRGKYFEQKRDDSWNSRENQHQDSWNASTPRTTRDTYLVKGSTLTLSRRSQSSPSCHTESQSPVFQRKQHHLGSSDELQRERYFQQTRPRHLILESSEDDRIPEEPRMSTAEKLVTTAFEFESPEMEGTEAKDKDGIEEGDDNYMRVEVTDFNNTEQ